MSSIDKTAAISGSFLERTQIDGTADKWQIPENLSTEVITDKNQIEDFLTSFNIPLEDAEKYSSQLLGLSSQEIVAFLNRDDNNILSSDEILSVLDATEDKELSSSELDIILTNEGTLDADAFRAFVRTLDPSFTEAEIDELIAYFSQDGMTAESIITELTSLDDSFGLDDLEDIFEHEE